jgi:hypothetical protein
MVLPQKSEISMPGRPKRFIAIGIYIPAMAMSTFNTMRITQLNEEINTLKEKILDIYTKNICTTWKEILIKQTFGEFVKIKHFVLLQSH